MAAPKNSDRPSKRAAEPMFLLSENEQTRAKSPKLPEIRGSPLESSRRGIDRGCSGAKTLGAVNGQPETPSISGPGSTRRPLLKGGKNQRKDVIHGFGTQKTPQW